MLTHRRLRDRCQALSSVIFGTTCAVNATCNTELQNLAQRGSGCDLLISQTIEVSKAPIANSDTLIAIEHTQTVGYVIQRNVELMVDAFEPDLVLLQGNCI